MFDSRRSFSLEYDLIRSPVYLKSLESVASPTSRLASVFYPLTLPYRVTLDLSSTNYIPLKTQRDL